MILGIIASFIGALLQAGNYLITQDAQHRFKVQGLLLLIGSQIVLGIIGLLCVLIFGYYTYLDMDLLLPLLKVNIPYIIGQYALIRAIQTSDAGIASPLMTLKVPVLALLTLFVSHQYLSLIQWIAIFLIIGIAYFFSTLSGQITLKPLFFILLTCLGYSISDMSILELSQQFPVHSAIEKSFITNCINYCFILLLLLPLLIPSKITAKQVWQLKWVGLSWFFATIFVVTGFNLSGVVSANVIQSLRGVLALILGLIFFRDTRKSPTIKKKLLGALGMCLGVALFYIEVIV